MRAVRRELLNDADAGLGGGHGKSRAVVVAPLVAVHDAEEQARGAVGNDDLLRDAATGLTVADVEWLLQLG